MSTPTALVLGTGRMAGGFVAPQLRAAGWDVVLAGRSHDVVHAINAAGGVRLRRPGARGEWLGGVRAVAVDDVRFAPLVLSCDLIVTSVGPGSLASVGALLGPALRLRTALRAPLNVLTLENHLRAPQLFLGGVLDECPAVAPHVGRTLGIAGVAAWGVVVARHLAGGAVEYESDGVSEWYADRASLVPAAPLDESIPALELVGSFDQHMLEKLWLFNAGHATCAYVGRAAGHATIDAAMRDPFVARVVRRAVDEARTGIERLRARRPWSEAPPLRDCGACLERYASPVLRDTVERVGREPRRKLAQDDRLIGPALACLAAGERPLALAHAAAAALAFDDERDREARDLQRELELVGAGEVLASVTGLPRDDELNRMIVDAFEAAPARAAA